MSEKKKKNAKSIEHNITRNTERPCVYKSVTLCSLNDAKSIEHQMMEFNARPIEYSGGWRHRTRRVSLLISLCVLILAGKNIREL